MKEEDRIAKAIRTIVAEMMDRVMERVLEKDPFIKEEHRANKPLYAALVPDEIFKGSHFERRFVTPFGKVWENLAKVVAIEKHGKCLVNHHVEGTIASERLRRIQEVLNRLEHGGGEKHKQKPSWDEELAYILSGKGEQIPAFVTCDIFVENIQSNYAFSVELKGPLSNSDQTKVSKEKMFKLLAMENKPVKAAYFALPYNPYGTRELYKWSFPSRWFDMRQDKSVLIGDEFWDFLGGVGTYRNFVEEINALGKNYRDRIYREFLGIEPPLNSNDNWLK